MSTISNSLAGLRAAQQRAAVAAQNVAKANISGVKALDFTQTVDTSGRVNGKVEYRNPATIKTLDGEGNEVELPNVSFDEELINAQIAVNDFQANAKALKIGKDAEKKLIDILA